MKSGAAVAVLPACGQRSGGRLAEVLTAFMAEPANRDRAGYGRFALDDPSPAARQLETMVAWRCHRLGLPYGDQLLIHRSLYQSVGGFPPFELMEDVAVVRRIGSTRLSALPMTVTTSAERYRRAGYIRRPLRNLSCLALYLIGRGAAGDPPAVRVRRWHCRRHLVIFARELRLGRGKRRLASRIGDVAGSISSG